MRKIAAVTLTALLAVHLTVPVYALELGANALVSEFEASVSETEVGTIPSLDGDNLELPGIDSSDTTIPAFEEEFASDSAVAEDDQSGFDTNYKSGLLDLSIFYNKVSSLDMTAFGQLKSL